MARNEKGGVHTQKVTAVFAVFIMLAGAVLGGACLMIAEPSDGANNVYIDGDDFAQVGKSITAKLEGDENYEFEAELRDGNGNKVGSVSPSTGSLNSENKAELKVTMPSKSGDYKLFVTYKKDDKVVQEFKGIPVKAVDPITLKANITNIGENNISFRVYFTVNGEKIDDSEQSVTIEKGKSQEVTYDYIIKDTKEIKFSLNSDDEVMKPHIQGLGIEHTVYTGKTDYMPFVIIAVIVLVAIIAVMIWIIRKPVINTGKPKARR